MSEKSIYRYGMLFIILLSSIKFAWADDGLYMNFMNVAGVIASILLTLARIAGILFLITAVVYYRRYRQNPHETPLNRVIWMLVFGLILFAFPWLAEQTSIYQEMQRVVEQS